LRINQANVGRRETYFPSKALQNDSNAVAQGCADENVRVEYETLQNRRHRQGCSIQSKPEVSILSRPAKFSAAPSFTLTLVLFNYLVGVEALLREHLLDFGGVCPPGFFLLLSQWGFA